MGVWLSRRPTSEVPVSCVPGSEHLPPSRVLSGRKKKRKAGRFAPTLLPKSGNAAAGRTAHNDTLAPDT